MYIKKMVYIKKIFLKIQNLVYQRIMKKIAKNIKRNNFHNWY